MSTDSSLQGGDLFLQIREPDNLWKDYNDAAYRVMCKYGDGHKQVLLTEVGFTDCGDERREEVQAGYTKKILEIAASLPYVRTIYNFRLPEETGMLKKEGIEKIRSAVFLKFTLDFLKNRTENAALGRKPLYCRKRPEDRKILRKPENVSPVK